VELFPEEGVGEEGAEDDEPEEGGGALFCCCANIEQLNPTKPTHNQLRMTPF
jgi:hypothetical protein